MGIRAKLVLFTALIIIGVIGIHTWRWIEEERGAIRDSFIRKADTLTHSLDDETAEHIQELRIHLLRLTLARSIRHGEVSRAWVLDAEGRVLTDGTGANPERGLPPAVVPAGILDAMEARHLVEEGSLLAARPVKTIEGETLGWVIVALSLESEQALIRQAIWRGTILAGLLALVGVLAAALLAGSITRPVIRLAGVTRAVEAGRRDLEMPAAGRDEVGDLTRGFDRMLSALARTERELRELNESLEQRVAERTTELARSNRDLRQFADAASHDLQEPLRIVASYLQMLKSHYGNDLDARAGDLIRSATDGTARMQALIEGLLDYSRLGSTGLALRPTDGEIVLARALDNLKMVIEESGAEIAHDPLPRLVVNEMQIVRLFQNLIGNSLKYRSEHVPRVHVSVQEGPGEWRFSVRDNGIGFEPRDAEKIFGLFTRLHSRERYPGTGIGLTICQRIVDLHGGRIWFESKLGEGSTFHFTLARRDGSGSDVPANTAGLAGVEA